MTRPAAPHIQLNRAYVQSKVIEANLQHLGTAIALADGSLQHDVQAFIDRFEEFVRRLNHASDAAAAIDEAARAA